MMLNCENINFVTRLDPCCGYVELNFKYNNMRFNARIRCPNLSHIDLCQERLLKGCGFTPSETNVILENSRVS